MNEQSCTRPQPSPTTALMLGQLPRRPCSPTSASQDLQRERGIVLSAEGMDGAAVYANLYENDRYRQLFQVVLGGPDSGNGRSKEVRREILDDEEVRGHHPRRRQGQRPRHRFQGRHEEGGPRGERRRGLPTWSTAPTSRLANDLALRVRRRPRR